MKLTGDYSFENNGRRKIIFRICEDDSLTGTVTALAALFEEPSVILYREREYILPLAVGRDSARLSDSIDEIRPERIEIGEGRGRCDTFFTVYPFEKDLICFGPIDCDFYKKLLDAGLKINL